LVNNSLAGKRDQVIIYTDGACSGNPGPGGWGAVLLWKREERRLEGGEDNTTNNRMELTAAIEALKALKWPCAVDLYSDSAYLINAFTKGWINKWRINNWMTSDKKPVENQDLWASLIELDEKHKISWHKVKGHSDDNFNSICDAMATRQAASRREAIPEPVDTDEAIS